MKTRILNGLRFAFVMVLLVGFGWGTYAVWRYFRTAPRFETERILPLGLKHLTEIQVIAAARSGFESGMNVFTVDLESMRKRVEELPWVRHALVQRVLPNQITVKIFEREPIGLARIGGDIRQFDADGVLLDAPRPEDAPEANFPVLDGMREEDPVGNRRRAEIYQKTMTELGADGISELRIDEGTGDISAVSIHDPMLVNLGTVDLRARWLLYLQRRIQIRQEHPEAASVDLRFRDQLIVRPALDEKVGRKVKWGAEKKNAL